MRRLLVPILLCLMVACAPRAAFEPAERDAPGTVREMLIATNRTPSASPLALGPGRGTALAFGRIDVSIPEDHRPGDLSIADAPGAAGFAVAGASALDVAGFRAAIRAGRPGAGQETVIFVHGYNNTPAEAVYRHAQMALDFGLTGPQVTFVWPSNAQPLGYVHDRDSVLQARDALADLIADTARTSRGRVVVVGHSMGAFLVMETLRGMGLSDRVPPLAAIVLLSPDIDQSLFETQLARIAPRPDAFVVAIDREDRVLRLSSRLAGAGRRLGSAADVNRLRALGITVLDLSGIGDGGHQTSMASPAAIALLRGLRRSGLPAEGVVDAATLLRATGGAVLRP